MTTNHAAALLGFHATIQLKFICLAETHLQRDESITLEGYTWFGHNRLKIHRNAIRGSGGVGILIKILYLNHTQL